MFSKLSVLDDKLDGHSSLSPTLSTVSPCSRAEQEAKYKSPTPSTALPFGLSQNVFIKDLFLEIRSILLRI